MLLILLSSLMIISLCILLHYSQHFRCQSCNAHHHTNILKHTFPSDIKRNSAPRSAPRLSVKTPLEDLTFRFHWCCTTNSDEEFDFFPLSFLLYIIYILFLSCLILFKYITEETTAFDTYYHNDPSYHIYKLSMNEIKFNLNHTTSISLLSYIDWIIYILIIFAMIWQSLFGYYRYYTTISSAKLCSSLTFMDLFKHFVTYMLVYTILFVCQTQIYYFLFPFIVLLYSMTNIYWIYKSTNVIIQSVKQMNRFENQKQLHNDLLYNVRLLRTFSLLSTIFSSIYISAFTIIYDIKIVYYFPMIWCISILLFACVFIRNRKFISHKCCCCVALKKTNEISLILHARSSELHTQIQLGERRSTFDTVDTVNKQKPEMNNKFVVCIDYIDEPETKLQTHQKQSEYKPHTHHIQIQIDKPDHDETVNDRKSQLFLSQQPNIITTPVSMNAMDKQNSDLFSAIDKANKSNSTGDLMDNLKNKTEFIIPATNNCKKSMKTPKSVPAYITNMISHSYQYILNKKKKINTPQSMNVISPKYKSKNGKKKLLNNLSMQFDMSPFSEQYADPDIKDTTDMKININMPTNPRQSITPISKTPNGTLSPYKKTMNKLLLPNIQNTITNMRSSSNPLLKSQIDKINESPIDYTPNTVTIKEDSKYDLFLNVMTPSVANSDKCEMDEMSKPVFKDVNSNPTPPVQHLDVIKAHRHSHSTGEGRFLKKFTLMDAIVELTHEPSYSAYSANTEPDNYRINHNLKVKTKRKRFYSDYPTTKKGGKGKKKGMHTHDASVASVVNLIVAQGLYDKRRAKKILKSAYV